MKVILFLLILSTCSCSYAKKTNPSFDAREKALKITIELMPYFIKNTVTLMLSKKRKLGKVDTAAKSIFCNKTVIDLSNGNQEKGAVCTVGLESGLIITFDSKLNPIKITYFEP